jgi:hypothetical protein
METSSTFVQNINYRMGFIDFHQSFEISENICCAAVPRFRPGKPERVWVFIRRAGQNLYLLLYLYQFG